LRFALYFIYRRDFGILNALLYREMKTKGVLFDVDGTLYHQAPLRAIMVSLLLLHHLFTPGELLRKIRVIKAYRNAQEELRLKANLEGPRAQVMLAAEISGESEQYVQEVVVEWFEKKPLPYLPLCRRRGMSEVVRSLFDQGMKLGVVSDYPVEEKLAALGISRWLSVVVSPGIDGVRGFKPNTNAFAKAAEKIGLDRSEVVYVGDRPDVDGAGASAAGMKAVIIGSGGRNKHRYAHIKSMKELLPLLNQ
jgi:FMN phosphatase YigB (HAD superfamily)